MRTINLNGYIDEEVFYGDEITPAMLHDALYGENGAFSDDVRIPIADLDLLTISLVMDMWTEKRQRWRDL